MSFQLKRLNKHIFFVAGVMLAGIGIVLVLAWNAIKVDEKVMEFNRKTSTIQPKLLSMIPRDKSIVDVAGVSEGSLYFQTRAVDRLFVTDRELKNSKFLTLNIPANNKIGSLFFSTVDSPAVNIVAGNARAVISGNISEIFTTNILPSKLFSRVAQISPDSYILRGFDSTVKTLDQIFLKVNARTGMIQREKGISEVQNDGGIGTDGQLNYDEKTKLLTFVEYYTNKIYCLDTNLNLVYTAKTFGPSNANESSKVSLSSKGELTNATPKRTINNGSYTINGLLYNQSKIFSKSDVDGNLNTNTVIDIYDVKAGVYKESIYFPSLNGQMAYKFKIYDNLLIVLYKDYIATYQLNN